MSRIFWILLIVCTVIGGSFWLTNRSRSRAMNNGAVFMRDQAEAAKNLRKAETGGSKDAPTTQAAQDSTAISSNGTSETGAGSENLPPASDSIPREPPDGAAFAGRGRYQLYRQGDITWRLDTETGKACILFATDAEWRKLRVFEQGCGGR